MTEGEEILARLEALYLLARRRFGRRRRQARTRRHAAGGVEWGGHRAYASGDDYRTLDWPLYGRLERLFVRLFEVEEDRTVAVLVDRSRSMGGGAPRKIDLACRVAAAIAYVALANLERVLIFPFAASLEPPFAPGRGRGQVLRALEFLRGLAPAGETALCAAARALAAHLPRAGLCFILSDYLDPRPEGLARATRDLRARRFDVFAVQVLSPEDAAPPADGDVVLADAETGEQIARGVGAADRAAYSRAFEAWCREVETACRGGGADYLRVDAASPFDEVVLEMLRRGTL